LAHCTLPQRKTSKAVAHRTVEEIWYFVSGTGQVWRKQGDKQQVVDVHVGTNLTIPRGVHFQFRNTGADNLCFLIATIPCWPGEQEAVLVPDYWQRD
jgi:mannose-6-phosphate isomerase-like protein (cupin superfamily)